MHLSILNKPLKKALRQKKLASVPSLEIPESLDFEDIKISACKPHYLYFHYLQDGEKDDGWGCAYRSLQTLCSWFLMQGHTTKKVPSISDIQKTLVSMGDKDAKFIGSREWIGAFEVSFVIQKELGYTCKVQYIPSGAQVATLLPIFEQHFREIGTPIMIGGGVLAYTLLGEHFLDSEACYIFY